ncbi:deoxyguanosinetriphosphate triphosphohydrolase [Salinibius halmophilus]|uniref:deoxyguanosinetriphosphate triphosphohydrolase n=1 Tax=Salinibius halmophilus TaxID=1853216 RepID=UPI003899FBE6
MMHWDQLLNTERYGHSALPLKEMGRSFFHKDYDRIVFSPAFRRLAGKTQVHPLAFDDHTHNRLIHSVEVGSVGRSLGIRIGEQLREQLPKGIKPDDLGVIVQSACLAHDIGNPPFGHAGEYAIRAFFQQPSVQPWLHALTEPERLDLQTFEGNAQGFRLATNIEYHLFDGGLRLTWPTLGALMKYPWTVEHANDKGKFGCYQQEKDILTRVGKRLGLVQVSEYQWARHPLSYLMEAADDTCYALIDLEDAVALDLLTYEEVSQVMLRICASFNIDMEEIDREASPSRKLAALRGKTIEVIITEVVRAFVRNHELIMRGAFSNDLLHYCSDNVKNGIAEAKQLAYERVFLDTHKMESEIGAHDTIATILSAFIGAGFELAEKGDAGLSFRNHRILKYMRHEAPEAGWTHYAIYMRILDFVSSMSDHYAKHLASVLRGYG